MYTQRKRDETLAALNSGLSLSQVSRSTGVARSTLRSWLSGDTVRPAHRCARCEGDPVSGSAYAALLGFYLGDGCLSQAARYYSLRISCDATLPGIVDDVTATIVAVRPEGKVFHVRAPGVIVVQSHWKHWVCLLPQHAPGRKHDRAIVLEPWQRTVVESHPGAFLRGLFHSDGCRVDNWTTRRVGGERRTYRYPRWQFVNHSDDIRHLCCWALDLVDVPWRRSSWKVISVSRREAVARLDALIGPKA